MISYNTCLLTGYHDHRHQGNKHVVNNSFFLLEMNRETGRPQEDRKLSCRLDEIFERGNHHLTAPTAGGRQLEETSGSEGLVV